MPDAPSATQPEVPILVSSGPTGRAKSLAPVLLVLRWVPFAFFLAVSAWFATAKAGLAAAPSSRTAAPSPVATSPTATSPATAAAAAKASAERTALVLFGGFGGVLLVVVVRSFLHRYVLRRSGRADFFADRIVVYKREQMFELPWAKVRKVVAKSRDYVQVVRSRDLTGSYLFAIPTPDTAIQQQIIELWERSRAPAPGATTAPAPGAATPPVPQAAALSGVSSAPLAATTTAAPTSPAAPTPASAPTTAGTPTAAAPVGPASAPTTVPSEAANAPPSGTLAPATPTPPKLLGRGATASPLLLVASGSAGWKRAKKFLDVGIVLVYIGALMTPTLVRRGIAPSGLLRFSTGRWELDFIILLVGYRVVRAWLTSFTNSRVGRAELFEDSIHFYRGDQATKLAWADVAGFDDGSTDFVRIARKGGGRLEVHSIPTPDEDTRLRVLAHLAERGVPRVESSLVS